MAGLLGNFDDEPQGLLGGLQRAVGNPMTLAGLGLLTGQGFGGAMRGMQMGAAFDQQRQEDARRRQFQGLLGQVNAPDDILRIAQMQGPDAGPATLAKWLDPAREADLAYKKAMTEKALRDAKNGPESPANVREWLYFSRLPKEQQQQYLTMKRAEKYLDTGTEFVRPNPVSPGQSVTSIPKNVAEAEELKKRGQWEGEAPQRDAGKQRLDTILSGLAEKYVDLDRKGAIVATDRGAMENIRARVGATEIGQALSGATGAEEQSIRQSINNSRPLLLQSIMQATGMSARALDSNKELEFYLQAVSDPKRDLQSNLAAIDAIDKTFGLGGVLQRTLPPDVYARVSSEADRQLAERPLSRQGAGQPRGPEPGTVEDGYRFRGGDPADRNNWEKM